MKKQLTRSFLLFAAGWLTFCTAVAQPAMIVVDSTGKGDFTSIQEAINSLPEQAASPRVIYIRNGTYHEKIFIEKNFVTLVGEDKNNTRLVIALARDIWRCESKDDWGAATLNLRGNDIVLQNLTISNSFGFDHDDDTHIDCASDSAHPYKTVKRTGHQMALRSFTTTRLSVINCVLTAYGGDTVSPWNTDNGMFYFKDCLMEGGVDFYCPRGWAYAENCDFVAHGNVAAIWHDGSKFKDSKTVLVNCRFRGDDGFKLGRYHRDAQFYLINCSFAGNMADAPVYRAQNNPPNEVQWGERVYYFNCHRNGKDFSWYADNLDKAEGAPKASDINPEWVFKGKWTPPGKPLAIKDKAVIHTGETPGVKNDQAKNTDDIAENMLVYQRAVGGWPKAVNDIKVDYNKTLSYAEKKMIKNDSAHTDATIDNNATMREIRYLAKAYKQTGNMEYLWAAEKGLRYYFKAQYPNGGWPQFYPDASLYRSQITYNDNAMVNVLNVLEDVVEGKNDMDAVDKAYIPLAAAAVQRGVECILVTQIRVNGKLTAWCAQYNRKTLEPEMARKFELVSLSGDESVGIVLFLMRVRNPSQQVMEAIHAAVQWFGEVKITGYKYVDIDDASLPKGKDRVIMEDPGSVIWARFYEIGTNRPFFSGRDSIKKYKVSEIEQERRIGYAWYGTWPEKLLNKEYPEWAKTHPAK